MAHKTLNVLLKYKTDLDRVPEGARPGGGDTAGQLTSSVVLDVLKGFVTELRAAGLPVSLTESIDAAEAVGHIPLEDREALKYALGATLVKSSAHWRAFETAFEVYFSMRGPRYAIDAGQDGDSELLGIDMEQEGDQGQGGRGRRGGGGGGEALSPEELAELLYRALRDVE